MQPNSTLLDQLRKASESPSLLQEKAEALLASWEHPPTTALEWMNLGLATERLVKIYAAGRSNDAELIAQLHPIMNCDWSDIARLPVKPGLEKNVAQRMLQELGLFPKPDKSVSQLLVKGSFPSRKLVETTVQHNLDHAISFDLEMDDRVFDTVLINALNEHEITGLAAVMAARLDVTSHAITFWADGEKSQDTPRDAAKHGNYKRQAASAYHTRVRNDDVRWTLTCVPTKEEAVADGFDYPDYLNFYFEACDQPWEQIKAAQHHLIQAFNKGEELHITNDDGTDIRMSIYGHTFANSVVARNMPGSEIFSGPVCDSVQGTLVAKGNFAIDIDGVTKRMKDITLTFENGRIVRGHAAEGDQGLQEILSLEDGLDADDPKFEGSRHIGEIGIGTNPYIRKHLVNGLLVEKISGSFHLALGGCYGNSYLGEETLMANGNESRIHWDLTTMLRGHGGRMYLDGQLIQKDGEWIDCPAKGLQADALAVLNDGWRALADKDRPAYWRNKLQSAEHSR